ncbi:MULTISPECIES: hypothetical protein [Psychrilyobacter]|uniref:Uncharacterized protein n=1 Tax=Psychrilyobacter piezotolerans TaxID=2293438 RepID=A0ABX9KHQ4_9FUSO|nr:MULTISPECIES: hypothetical protein [Psychrilyobacter]MCS5422313.1 hypothetical protein [Psychrilyobacter sp. S5]NDI77954.1 hypothetical protein [Psychrilyobacter piezotolerans]RDE62069.1 hypothetical protein DV867_07750 [Psychrilyobacter sp. S5]REI41316.1 hypothetical protein DYH56_07750 [Psychrilyobacter piezotolerans]
MRKKSLREKLFNSLEKRLEKLITIFNLFIFFPRKFNDFQRYDNLKLYIDSEELFLNNIDVLNGRYLRYDVILNYMGIKGIEEKNDEYLKIIENFINKKELEKKIKEKNEKQPILISNGEKILKDEVFKLSMALYKGKKRVDVKYDFRKKHEADYDFNWLKNNFNQNNIEIILEEYNNLRKKFYPQTNMLIWAPAHKYLKNIKKEISTKSYITKEVVLEFDTQNELKQFLEEVYCSGNNIFGRVQQKWDRIKDEELKIIVLWAETNLSKREKGFLIEMVELKKRIRSKISKRMKNYVFDSVIHMGGNRTEINELDEILDRYI